MSSNALHVLVLSGGISHEREISLRSGARVAEALRKIGVTVTTHEPDGHLLETIEQQRPDVVWPVLHGTSGEDGALRNLLEVIGIPFVGSSSDASRLAWDKSVAKGIMRRAGVQTPESVTLPRDAFKELDAPSVLRVLVSSLALPLVVKPNKGGSSQGVSFVTTSEQLPGALVNAYTYNDTALLERRITGTEITIAVMDLGSGPLTFPVVEIDPRLGEYSFEARYTAGETRFYCPARISPELTMLCNETAITVHQALGLTGMSRIDFILDEHGVPWFLEANVLPGMTETSSVPLAIKAAGYNPGDVYRDLAEAALR